MQPASGRKGRRRPWSAGGSNMGIEQIFVSYTIRTWSVLPRLRNSPRKPFHQHHYVYDIVWRSPGTPVFIKGLFWTSDILANRKSTKQQNAWSGWENQCKQWSVAGPHPNQQTIGTNQCGSKTVSTQKPYNNYEQLHDIELFEQMPNCFNCCCFSKFGWEESANPRPRLQNLSGHRRLANKPQNVYASSLWFAMVVHLVLVLLIHRKAQAP